MTSLLGVVAWFSLAVFTAVAASPDFPLTVQPSEALPVLRTLREFEAPAGYWGTKEPATQMKLGRTFVLTVTPFNNAITYFYDLKITQSGRKHALYTHVNHWALSDDRQYIAVQNYLQKKGTVHQEQVRIINIASKRAVKLPAWDCTADIQRWSQGTLITTSSVEGTSVTICLWNKQGSLIAKLQGQHFATGTTEKTINRIGIIPKEPTVLYTLGVFDDGPVDDQCHLIAIDLKDPSRTEWISFDPNVEHYHCSSPVIELDLSEFTIEKPFFRFRAQDWSTPDAAGNLPFGPWTEVQRK